MIDNLFRLFQDLVSPPDAEAKQDDQNNLNENALDLAAVALMLEVARSDRKKHQVELEAIERILSAQTESSVAQEMIATASEQVETAHDLYQFTHLINEHFDNLEKRALINRMWQVAYADGHIEAFEDHIIRRVAGLIHLEHKDFIQEKLKARDS